MLTLAQSSVLSGLNVADLLCVFIYYFPENSQKIQQWLTYLFSVYLATLSPPSSHFKSQTHLWRSPSPPSFIAPARRWCREAISHIQFTYGCHWLLQAERWCHLCVGPSVATRCMGRLLAVGGGGDSPWWEHYHCSSAVMNMMNVGWHFCVHVRVCISC